VYLCLRKSLHSLAPSPLVDCYCFAVGGAGLVWRKNGIICCLDSAPILGMSHICFFFLVLRGGETLSQWSCPFSPPSIRNLYGSQPRPVSCLVPRTVFCPSLRSSSFLFHFTSQVSSCVPGVTGFPGLPLPKPFVLWGEEYRLALCPSLQGSPFLPRVCTMEGGFLQPPAQCQAFLRVLRGRSWRRASKWVQTVCAECPYAYTPGSIDSHEPTLSLQQFI
jgi:hypothetical protein